MNNESNPLIDVLSKMPDMVIATAYLYAINYTLYGADITEKWETATKYSNELKKAYEKGYYDALLRQKEVVEEREPKWIPVSEGLPKKDKYNHGVYWERTVLVTSYLSYDDAKRTSVSQMLAKDVVNGINSQDEYIVAWMPLPKPYKAESEDKDKK